MNKETAELRDLFADKQALEEKRKQIKEKALAHRDDVEGAKQAKTEITEIDRQLREVDEKIKKIQEREENTKMDNTMLTRENMEEMQKRAEAFAASGKMTIANAETRSVLISGGKIATPTGVSGINDAFNKVSSIVDQVKVVDCNGMGGNKVAYEKNIATADKQTEGGNYNESDPEFDFKTITPETIAVISYISKQVQRQSPLMYEAKVRESALNALRKKAGSMIIEKILASDLNVEVSGMSAIGADTLRKIAMNYGGDENVVGNAVLYINKKDLIKFGDVRGTNEKKAVYEITPDTANPNTGIIKDGGLSVQYCIVSALTENTLIYGQPMNCELDIFSDYEIAVSEDFKFNQGLLAIRGDVQLGADVVKAEGFVKVTIA